MTLCDLQNSKDPDSEAYDGDRFPQKNKAPLA